MGIVYNLYRESNYHNSRAHGPEQHGPSYDSWNLGLVGLVGSVLVSLVG
jgi:hypothetical protein